MFEKLGDLIFGGPKWVWLTEFLLFPVCVYVIGILAISQLGWTGLPNSRFWEWEHGEWLFWSLLALGLLATLVLWWATEVLDENSRGGGSYALFYSCVGAVLAVLAAVAVVYRANEGYKNEAEGSHSAAISGEVNEFWQTS